MISRPTGGLLSFPSYRAAPLLAIPRKKPCETRRKPWNFGLNHQCPIDYFPKNTGWWCAGFYLGEALLEQALLTEGTEQSKLLAEAQAVFSILKERLTSEPFPKMSARETHELRHLIDSYLRSSYLRSVFNPKSG